MATLGAWVLAAVALAALAGEALAASTIEDLYQARAIVTGTRAETRGPGLAQCLEDVLVKVAGDPRLIGDKRVARLARKPVGYVRGYSYHDRMTGIPYHDEQGSRDRPFDLIVDFEPAKIDAALRTLGRRPWTAPRPRLVVFVAVSGLRRGFMVASEGDDDRERDSLLAASRRRGMPVTLPSRADLAAAGASVETLAASDLAALDAVAKRLGGDVALVGAMTWNEQAIAWTAEWRLRADGKTQSWGARDTTVDDAFRAALGRAALAFSGNDGVKK